MNKNKVRALSLVLASGMMVLAGCGATEKQAGNQSAGAGNSSNDHMDISISYFDIGKDFQSPDKDELLQTIQKKFNVTFKPMQVSWSDYGQKYQIWATSGQLPDVFSPTVANDNPAVYNSWIKQGVVKALPADLSKYPNIAKEMTLPDVQPIKVNGKFYAVPRLTYPNNDMDAGDRAILVRKDWLQKLGMDTPKSFDDLVKLGAAFATKDPDGDGKQDTVGLLGNTTAYLSYLTLPVLPQMSNGNESWLQEDGKWIPYYASKKMDTVVTDLRKLYTDGALGRDFATSKDDPKDLFAQGKVGVFVYSTYPGHLYDLANRWNKYNPNEKFTDAVTTIPLWASDDGTKYHHSQLTWWSESMFSSKVSDAKMDRILQIYDYLKSPEGRTLLQYGVEGKDYKKDGDKITITRQKDAKTGQFVSLMEEYPSLDTFNSLAGWDQERSYVDNDANKANFGADVLKMGMDNLNNTLKNNPTPIPSNWQVNAINTPAKSKLKIDAFTDITKVILGTDDPVKMWHSIVDGYNSQGLPQAIDEVNAKVKELGIK